MARFGFDLDGVIADIIPALYKKSLKMELVPSDTKCSDIHDAIHIQFNWPDGLFAKVMDADFFYDLEPIPYILKMVQNLLNIDQYVMFITSRHVEEDYMIADKTIDWLKKYNIWDKSYGCFFTTSDGKYEIAKKHNLDLFVDDYPKVINNMNGHIKYPCLLATQTNQNDERRQTWNVIEEKIKELII